MRGGIQPQERNKTCLSTDALLMHVRCDHHRLSENVQLLRDAIQEDASLQDESILMDFDLSWPARQFVLASRLATFIAAMHITVYVFAKRVLSTSAVNVAILERSSAGCHLLWRGSMCERYNSDQGPSVATAAALNATHSQGTPLSAADKISWARRPALRLVWLLMTDFVFGVVLMAGLLFFADDFADWLVKQSELTAVLLSDLLKWLMGVPAGLKLNNQLSNFMGRFFLYHIYLWGLYVRLVAPLLAPLLRCIAMCGLLGGSLVLCLLSDLLSLFLFHTYCFYIYACRVFCVQIYMLAALLRLFAGTKWNILRRRVDSLQSTSEQYLLGTLLFTVMLWLLPTTTVFYVVFASVRLVVLLIYCSLSWTVLAMDHFPLVELLLRVCGLSRLEKLDFKLLTAADYQQMACVVVKLNVSSAAAGTTNGSARKFLTLHQRKEGQSEASRGAAEDHPLYLLACGRPRGLLDILRGCPYGQCSAPGLLPPLGVVSLLQSLLRGYIIHGPRHRLCRPAVLDSG